MRNKGSADTAEGGVYIGWKTHHYLTLLHARERNWRTMEHDEQPCPEDNEVIDVVSWSVPPPSEESKLDQPKTAYNLLPRPTSLHIRALEIPQHLADSVGAVARDLSPRGGVAEVSITSKVRKLLEVQFQTSISEGYWYCSLVVTHWINYWYIPPV